MAVATGFFEKTDEQKAILEMVRQFVDEQIIPQAEHFDAALKGVNRALRYYAGRYDLAQVKTWMLGGFARFARVQAGFMAALGE